MEGMTILSYLLVVVAIIIVCTIVYWIISRSKNADTEQKTQEPTFPAARIATEDPASSVENNKVEEIKYVSSVKLMHKRGGGVLGAVGCAMAAFLCLLYADAADITVFQSQMLNYYTLTVIAAVLSFFGTCFHDASCVLLAAVALVSAFFLDMGTALGLIPAVVLAYSYERMKHNMDIEVKRKSFDLLKKQGE